MILRLNIETLEWSILKSPANFIFQDYACAVTLANGSIFIAGGIDSKASKISKQCGLFYIDG